MSNHKASKGHHKRSGGHEEEHENHERWLVTYADMLTLLMVLFVVLFAMSSVDAKKFTALRDGLAKGFGAPAIMSGTNNSVQTAGGSSSAIDVAAGVGKIPAEPQQAQDPALQKAVQDADRARQQRMQQSAQQEVANLEKIKQQILEAAKRQGMQEAIRFGIDERGLVVTIVTSEVIFAGDRADLLAAGRRILDSVAPALTPLPNKIEVDGHTNQLPVPTMNYPSAWELSSARASMVARYLINNGHLPSSRLSVSGFAGERPLYDPSDPRAPQLNRRVDIVVLSTLPPAERALLPSAAGPN
ncbi:OmpA/MotB family protein [Planosporangium mesophilum]|uniref:Chemotaxis protein MotB n=1 Tax=Planosporangium mesophilum TaxID=689768 RepID=A0A8J3TGR4_9ACTN|nr:flagellar motor protein MotB [Planosporangium mesophilum]NJC86515.1 flagellar motor protein MotB [Planosporangium mesophilum]GII26158.1 chemotaxis protein MotB [Planosporangium mesophilum]